MQLLEITLVWLGWDRCQNFLLSVQGHTASLNPRQTPVGWLCPGSKSGNCLNQIPLPLALLTRVGSAGVFSIPVRRTSTLCGLFHLFNLHFNFLSLSTVSFLPVFDKNTQTFRVYMFITDTENLQKFTWKWIKPSKQKPNKKSPPTPINFGIFDTKRQVRPHVLDKDTLI